MTRENTLLKVAIIGVGKVGRTRLNILEAHPDVRVVALADTNDQIASEFTQYSCYTNYTDLLNNEDVDIVFVATTNKHSALAVIQSLEAGKHVFCEKPPGRSIEDIENIVTAERRFPNRKLQFGFNHRFHYGVMEAKSIIDSQVLGKVLWARGIYGKMGGAEFETCWRSKLDESGGGILLDQGIHMLDLFRYFMGDFNQVQSIVQTMHWDIPMEDNAFALLKTQDNKVAMLHSSATQWKHKFNLEVCMEEGYLNLTGILSSTQSYGDETLVYARKDYDGHSGKPGNPKENKIFFDKDHSWSLEINSFLNAIKTDTPILSGNSEDALKAMQMVFDIYNADK